MSKKGPDQFIVRLPDGMRDRIKAAADRNNRSMNSEILLALEYWLETDMPYTFPLTEWATADDARQRGAADREERFSGQDFAYDQEIERAIHVLKSIQQTLKAR